MWRVRCSQVLLTYLLTPWCRVPLEEIAGFQLVKKFPAFYGTRRFINAFTSARHLSLSCASLVHCIPPHSTSWRSILILSSHLRLGLPSCFFPSSSPTPKNTVYASPLPHTRCMPRPFLPQFYHPINIGEQYGSFSSSLCSFRHCPVAPSLLGSNILLSKQLYLLEFNTPGMQRCGFGWAAVGIIQNSPYGVEYERIIIFWNVRNEPPGS